MIDRASLGQLMLIGIPDPVFSDTTKRLLESIRPGSLVLFSRNVVDAEQLGRLLEQIDEFLGYHLIVGIDQEGGRVTRLRDGFTVVPDARAVAEGGGPPAARQTGEIIGREMAAVGIDWTFAPVVDILSNPDNPGVGLRSFGQDADTVVACASAFLDGLHETGVEGCLKHFPGLGRVGADPHFSLPVVSATAQELYATELDPYRRIPARAWMPTHVSVPALDPTGTPATLSKPILTDLARSELGFTGVLAADDLMMGGITTGFTLPDALAAALDAGMDYLTLCHEPDKQIAAFEEFATRVPQSQTLSARADESLARVRAFVDGIRRETPSRNAYRPAATSRTEPRITASSAAGPSGRAIPSSASEAPRRDIARSEDAEAMVALSRAAVMACSPEGIHLRTPDLILAPRARGFTPAAEPEEGVPRVAARIADAIGVPLEPYAADALPAALGRALDASGGSANLTSVLMFTENACTSTEMSSRVEAIATWAKSIGAAFTVVALGAPNDRRIPGCEQAICTYGSSGPQAVAIEQLLLEAMEAIDEPS